MKKLLFILAAGVSVATFSCKKDSADLAPASANGTTTGGGGGAGVRTTQYIWKINSYISNGTDMTAQFADYQFDLRAPQLMIENGELVAVRGGATYHGKWTRLSYSEVNIEFPANNLDLSYNLTQLNGTWTLTNNQVHDISMQSGSRSLSFHNDGEIWPAGQ